MNRWKVTKSYSHFHVKNKNCWVSFQSDFNQQKSKFWKKMSLKQISFKISQLICSANQLTGFYMIATLTFNEELITCGCTDITFLSVLSLEVIFIPYGYENIRNTSKRLRLGWFHDEVIAAYFYCCDNATKI